MDENDDTADFAIPDVTFFAVSALMIGAALDTQNAAAYREHALYQLRTSIDTFLVKDSGLARTLYRKDGIGTTYLWALPAENRDMRLRDEMSGWAMGFVLAAANEMTL